jgi:hypothetical protein
MNRILLLLLAALPAFAPCSRAAAPFHAGLAFAVEENAAAGTDFWCAFPDVPNHWTVVLYEKRREGFMGATYRQIGDVTKTPGPSWRFLCQMMTVPKHSGRECFLVAYRNGIQQPYRGFTKYSPFGWHTFGVEPPAQAFVVEIPSGTPAKEINNYERAMRKLWTRWPRR